MKKKNIILIAAIALCLAACILLLLVNVFKLNIIKHGDIQLLNISVKYYGNFNSVKAVKIYDVSIRRGTFELTVDKSILDNSKEYAPYLDDLNGDGHNDILIPHSLDANNSIRYALYIWNNENKMFEGYNDLADLANISFNEEGNLTSFSNLHNVIFEAQANVPKVYENHRIITEFKLVDGIFRMVSKNELIYYSDTDIYCLVTTEFDDKTGEVVSFIEDWLNEKEASEIKFYK
ncbi:MAG: hypothetical protein IKB02_02330 [Clostridia bacterium]|nr:hypothetical protein [Clostridia bacterium]